ncbi:MAG TPA: FAD-binding oxidoreductase [Pyrinomonadaceae bacterium]|nr:FAD-binding oxidoreductase [Pyrinomonadaceae bacterium]
MSETTDVCIIGGGVVGASIAYHLTAAGCSNVLIVEREAHPGMGSTGKATGGIRAQFGTEVNVRMSLYSIDFFTRFEEATGHPSGYRPAGYLFLATDARQLEYLHAARSLQASAGLTNVEHLSREAAARLLPQMRSDDILGANFCPTDGFISPHGVLRGLMHQARARGARLLCNARVRRIETDARGVACVSTTRGEISTRTVVNAAGAWAAEVARLVGVEIPVAPLRRQIVVARCEALPGEFPMVVDMSDGFHFRPEIQDGRATGNTLLAWSDDSRMGDFQTNFEPSFAAKIIERAGRRVPSLAGAQADYARSRAGLYEMTPDHHAIVGRAPGLAGFYLANGFSGHGVMHSPATGRIVSDLILEGRTALPGADALRAERFLEGKLIEEPFVL